MVHSLEEKMVWSVLYSGLTGSLSASLGEGGERYDVDRQLELTFLTRDTILEFLPIFEVDRWLVGFDRDGTIRFQLFDE